MSSAARQVVDDRLIETGVVFLARNPLFADGERNIAVTKQARADVVVVGIDPEDINVLLDMELFSVGTLIPVGTAFRPAWAQNPISRRGSLFP
jgi:hypothetical protein